VDGDRVVTLVEEDEIEREAHPQGVNCATAGNQQAATNLIAIEPGKAEQAGAEVAGDPDLMADGRGERQTAQPAGERSIDDARRRLPA
jgi:hypothetical protein